MALPSQSPIISNLEDPQKIADFYGVSYRSVAQSIPVLVRSIMAKTYVPDAVSPFDIARNAKIEQWYEDETGRPWSQENAVDPISPFLFGPPGHGKSIAFRLASKMVAERLGMRYLDNSSLAEDGQITLPPKLPEGLEDKIASAAIPYPPPTEVGPNDFVFLTYEMSGEVAKGDFGGPPDIRETNVQYVVKDDQGRVKLNGAGEATFANRTERISVRAMPLMLASFKKSGGGCLVLDDFTNAAPYIQNIGLGLFQNGSYQGMRFPANVIIGGTGNQGSVDGTYADALSTAAKGRLDAHYTQDTMLDYISRIDSVFKPSTSPARNMFATVVGDFMQQNPSMFARLPPGDILFLRSTGQRVSAEELEAMLTHPDPSSRWSEDDVDEKIGMMPSPGGQGYPSPRNWDNAINMLGMHWLSVSVVGHPRHEEDMARFLTLMDQQLTSDVGPKIAGMLGPVMAERLISQGYLDLGAQLVRRGSTGDPLPEKMVARLDQVLASKDSGRKTSHLGWMVDGAYKEVLTMLEQHDTAEINAALVDPAHPVRGLISSYLRVAASSGREDIFERSVERLTRGLRSDSDFVNSAWMEPHPTDQTARVLSGAAQEALMDVVKQMNGAQDAGLDKNLADLASHNIQRAAPVASGIPAPAVEKWQIRSWVEEGAIPADVAANYWSYETEKRNAWAQTVLESFVGRPGQDSSTPTSLSHAVGIVSSLDATNARVFMEDLVHVATEMSSINESPQYMVSAAFWLNQIKDHLSGPKALELSDVVQGAMDNALGRMQSIPSKSKATR